MFSLFDGIGPLWGHALSGTNLIMNRVSRAVRASCLGGLRVMYWARFPTRDSTGWIHCARVEEARTYSLQGKLSCIYCVQLHVLHYTAFTSLSCQPCCHVLPWMAAQSWKARSEAREGDKQFCGSARIFVSGSEGGYCFVGNPSSSFVHQILLRTVKSP